MQGMVGKRQLLIPVDSGSSTNFIRADLAKELKCSTEEIPAATVTVANGGTLPCNTQVPNLQWFCQGNTFNTQLKVLPLGTYDIILGMQWLETMSPMWVDWRKKIMRFKYQGTRITLRGVKDKLNSCTAISGKHLQGLLNTRAVEQVIHLCHMAERPMTETCIPPEVQPLIDKHQQLFTTPDTLPPHREFDHQIPLLPGAKPVNVKPYRYNPMQKQEIETQVATMLTQGVIQHSTSSFASPVLLVRKKDGTWRFCVDYRMLNSVTVQHKYPMPIVEELLDELAGAKYFTKLDLRAGYHQIDRG